MALWPREHGAYAQLLVPLAVSFALRSPTRGARLIAAGACFAFVATQPLRVVMRRRSGATRAARRLAMTSIGAVVMGMTGLALAPRSTVAVAGIVGAPAAITMVLLYRRREHSLGGELVAAVALCGAAAVVASASGLAWQRAAALWTAWTLGYGATIVAVHRVIARHKRPPSRFDRIVALGPSMVALLAIAAAAVRVEAVAAVPLATIATAIVLHPPRASRLRPVGMAIVVASIASALLVVGLAPT